MLTTDTEDEMDLKFSQLKTPAIRVMIEKLRAEKLAKSKWNER